MLARVREVTSDSSCDNQILSETAEYFMTIPSEGYSSEVIVAALENLHPDKVTFSPKDYNLSTKLKEAASSAKVRFMDFVEGNEFGHSYRMRKNPGMSRQEVISLVEKLKLVRPMLAGVEVKQIARDTFCIFKAASEDGSESTMRT
jgi:hypothetical protein